MGDAQQTKDGVEERRDVGKKMISRLQQRIKQSFYLTSQLKMNSLWDAMCGRPNGAFAVCWKQNRLWRCVLHKIMLFAVSCGQISLVLREKEQSNYKIIPHLGP